MKRLLIFSLLVTTTFRSFCQSQNVSSYQCPCSKIGFNPDWADSSNLSCYLIPVLRNSAKPSAGKYLLAAAVAKASAKTTEAPLLYLHGGPGIATLENLPYYLKSATWKLLRQKHDLIFFDYRGTGNSEPLLCAGLEDSVNAFKKINSLSKSEYEVSLYKKCREKLLIEGTDPATFNSIQLAADAEAVRNALRIERWNIYGVSYGTTIALNILRNFSANINSVILDSPFPPNAPWRDFVRPFDTCFKVLEKNIAANNVTAKTFPSLRKDFTTAVNRLNNKPALLTYKKQDDTLDKYEYTGDDFAWSLWNAMLKPKSIAYVPAAIKEIANGADSVLQLWSTAFSSTDAFGKFSAPQSNAILCLEIRPVIASDSEASLRIHYPDFTSFNSAFPAGICNVWQPNPVNEKIFDAVVSDVPVLILSGEYDPVCPPLFAGLTAKKLSNSSLLVVPSASHAAIHFNDCIRKMADDFLLTPVIGSTRKCISDIEPIKFITTDLCNALKNYGK